MKKQIFAVTVLSTLAALLGCTSRADMEDAARAVIAPVVAANSVLTRENEAHRRANEQRQAVAAAGVLGEREARASKLRHTSGCNVASARLEESSSYSEFGVKMVPAYKAACRAAVVAMASERKLEARKFAAQQAKAQAAKKAKAQAAKKAAGKNKKKNV